MREINKKAGIAHISQEHIKRLPNSEFNLPKIRENVLKKIQEDIE